MKLIDACQPHASDWFQNVMLQIKKKSCRSAMWQVLVIHSGWLSKEMSLGSCFYYSESLITTKPGVTMSGNIADVLKSSSLSKKWYGVPI